MSNIKIYTLEEIAELLKLSVRTLYTYIENGRLKATKLGGKWIVTEKALKDLIEGNDKDTK